MIVVWLFLAVELVCLQFVIVVFRDHTHYLLKDSSMVFKDNKIMKNTKLYVKILLPK